ncbi:MAG: calcium/sodium antiporter [Roseovarius sp.]|nr:calcium/sodium antiporter [Roseovarius sp.]
MMPWLMVALGLLILLLAGDALVKGAVNLSLRIGIPALIVSLTVVAFGTSAPELLVSVNAVLVDKPALGLGNVVGSNIANVLLVLGLPAVLAVTHTSRCDCRRSYLQMLAASVLFIALAFRGSFDRIAGLVLLGALALMLADAFHRSLLHRRDVAAARLLATEEEEVEGADPDMPWWQIVTFLVLGLIGLPLGADILVDNASILALRYGVSEAVIGLTLVAVGTSLPELATTIMAALRSQADVALGNVIGSNMFNLLAIIGVTAMVGRVPVNAEFLSFDLWVMLAASLILIPFVFLGRDIGRIWGIGLTAGYAGYVLTVLN